VSAINTFRRAIAFGKWGRT